MAGGEKKKGLNGAYQDLKDEKKSYSKRKEKIIIDGRM